VQRAEENREKRAVRPYRIDNIEDRRKREERRYKGDESSTMGAENIKRKPESKEQRAEH
jgi:hypothetical protein